MQNLKNKIIIITGAARGIGKAITEIFAENGAVVYACDVMGDLLNETVEEISIKYNAEVIPLVFDITDTKAQKEAFQRVWKERKRLDVLVNNAGVGLVGLIEMNTKAVMERLFAINTIPVIEMTQLAVKLMKRNEIINNTRGSIINISSMVGVHGDRGQVVYSGSKAAVIGITKSSSKELAEHLIRVNSIAPGLIQTPMTGEGLSEEIIKEDIEKIGMHRIGLPQDIAGAALFFASDLSNYITGQVLEVSGGFII